MATNPSSIDLKIDESVDHAHAILAAANKPFWLSKKVVLTAVMLCIAFYQAYTGKTSTSMVEALDKIQSTATWLIPLAGLVLSIARVDATTRAAALDFLGTLKTLETPDAGVSPEHLTAIVDSISRMTAPLASPAPEPVDPVSGPRPG